MTPAKWITLLTGFFLGDWGAAFAAAPNVIVFLTDDQGWGDLSFNGNTDLETPNIDSLGHDGASFDSFYVCPVCSPTRAEFLTGRYHARGGVYSTSAGGERLDLDEATIADSFRKAGYRTGAFGKWHNGMQFPYHPNGRGFEEFYGFCSGHWGDYFSPPLEHNGVPVQGKGFVVDDFTDRAMEFIRRHREEPFFVYLPYNTPHSPMQVPDEFWNRFQERPLRLKHRDPKKENDLHKRCALAMCENIDWNVGRVLGLLDELSLAENTMVLFFHDNGPNGSRWNGGMRGKKGSTDEGGVRSPLLMRWPARITPGTQIRQIAGAIDLHPTLTALAGIEPVSAQPLDGMNLAPWLFGEGGAPPDRLLISQWKNRLSVRSQQYRLDDKGQLYDIPRDRGQHHNVAGRHPSVVARLKEAASNHLEEVKGYDVESRPFLLTHPGAEIMQIPARDAVAKGGLIRSNRFPNCSYFFNWTSTDDALVWEGKAEAGGTYRVGLQYACRPGDVGTELELSFGEASLAFQVTEAHDPPVRGGENDRVVRQESYVRDFKTVEMGTIELQPGTGKLTLRATSIPGERAIDFRLLTLTRL